MSGKHTPGPWRKDESGMIRVLADAISESGEEYNLVIATCDPDVQLLFNDREVRANARLIASAPELLAAAKLWCQWRDEYSFLMPELSQVENALMAAIAKAEES